MATTINFSFGNAPTQPTRVIQATADLTAVTSYATGGVALSTLLAALGAEAAKLGTNYYSPPIAAHNGSATRYFKANPTTGKLQAFTTAACNAEVAGSTDLSGYTAVPVVIIGE